MYVALAGNIGVGKTSAAEEISLILGYRLVREKVADNPFLARFYEDPARWAFSLQMYNLAERANDIDSCGNYPDVVLDRSLEEDLIYVRVARDIGHINSLEYEIYENLFELLLRRLPKPDLLVFLVADVATLELRIRARARVMEKNISSEYLSLLGQHYRDWFYSYADPKVLIDVSGSTRREVADEIVSRMRL